MNKCPSCKTETIQSEYCEVCEARFLKKDLVEKLRSHIQDQKTENGYSLHSSTTDTGYKLSFSIKRF